MANDKDRERALDLAVSQIEKQFGKGSIMKLGADGIIRDIPTISTGSLSLDLALGIGGLPRGRVVEIYGPEASGKTTMALHVVAQAQKEGGTCAYIDAEHALDMGYAQKLGVKADELLVSQPDNGEQALEITDTLVRSSAVDRGSRGCSRSNVPVAISLHSKKTVGLRSSTRISARSASA